jgi:hypothetical protein
MYSNKKKHYAQPTFSSNIILYLPWKKALARLKAIHNILIFNIIKINLFNSMKLQVVILVFERGALALQIKNIFIELRNFLTG